MLMGGVSPRVCSSSKLPEIITNVFQAAEVVGQNRDLIRADSITRYVLTLALLRSNGGQLLPC